MKKKLKLVVLVGCLLILVNMSIAGTSLADDPGHEQTQQEDPLIPVVLVHHADANGPYSGDVDEAISFSGSGTWMSATGGIFYEWDFDDGTTGYGKYPTHAYSEPGVYYVTLTVTNGIGDVYKDIAPVYIERMADHLTPIGGCHYHGDVGETITFDASDSESTGAEIVQYFWDFGDGESAVGEQATHSYDEARVYMVTLDIKDSNGFTRHDVLHADIGRSYSDEWDLFPDTLSEEMQTILEYLLDSPDFTAPFFYNLLDAKIYTKYNDEDPKYTSLPGLFETYREIDVNDDGDNDIRVNKPKFFKHKWAHSMFDEHSRLWLQFETTLSEVIQLSTSTIDDEDDFTICLQLDFDIISQYLELDDTIMRVGYNSPPGQEMPDDIELVHIIRPYLLFRMFGFLNNQNVECGQAQGVATAVVYNTLATAVPMGGPGGEPIDEGGDTSGSGDEPTAPIGSPESEELEGYAQPAVGAQQAQPAGDGNSEYWPEYGLELRSTGGGGSFSLMTEFINLAGSSKTTAKISTDASSTSTFMYKRTKDGGILNHATVFEIPGDSATFEAFRNKNGVVTELGTGFSFSTKLFRGMGWSDSGVYFGILGDTEVSLNNFYFNNPGTTLDIGEISLDTHGSFNFLLNQEGGVKVDLDGSLGFGISDLYFDSTDLDVNIIGDFAMEVTSPAHFALGPGILEAGFTGTLGLYTDAIFEVNGQTIDVGGDFELEADGTIKFTWGSNEFNIDLDAGGELTITNLHFEVGDLTASAAEIGIEADGQFDIFWVNQEVTINGGSGASLYLRDVNITINNRNSLYIRIIGDLTIEADGEITFGPDVFKAEFSGLLDLGASVEFEINGESIIVGGKFDFDTGNGEIIFSWENGDFSLDVSSNFELSIENLYFEIGFDTGDLIVNSELVEIGLNGEFNVVSDNGEVTISGDAGASLGVQDLTVSLTIGNPDLTIQIIGWFEVEADGWVTFGSGVFKAGFDGELDLGTATQFVINGEGVTVGGTFYMTGSNNEMSFLWDDEGFTFDIEGNTNLSVVNFYFEVDDVDLIVTADEIGIGISGQILIDWDSVNEQITISSGSSSVSFSLVDLYVNYADIITVEIVGSLDVEGNGYLTFGEGIFTAGFSGTLNLGAQTQFIINGDGITVGGEFELSSGSGEIGFTWDGATQEFTLYVSGTPSVTVSNLYFEAGDITVEAVNVEIGANGEFNLDWNTGTSEVTISSDGSVSLGIGDVSFVYGTTIDASITGSLEIQAEGEITLAPGTLDASFSGYLDFGTSCIFEINGDILTVGGLFEIDVGDGDISFTWSDTELTLDFTGSATLTVTNFYFEAGDLTVTGDEVEIDFSGQFDVYLDTASSEVTISSGNSGISLYIENVEITYGTTLNVEIIGSFELEANGWLTFGDGVFEAGFSGILDLGVSTQFIINGDGITVGGQFDLGIDDGDISFTWADDTFSLSVSGGAALWAYNLLFEAEISGETLTISAVEIGIGADGDLTIEWDADEEEITLSSVAGINFGFKNIDVSYGTFDISIIGRLAVQGDGSISVEPGEFEASFSGTLSLSDEFGFEINSEIVKLEGRFNLQMGSGNITISWSEDKLYCDLVGGGSLSIEDFYFEIEQLKIDAEKIEIGFNGDFTITIDKSNKEFEMESDLYFGFNNLIVNMNVDGNWHQICYVNNFAIGGGGYVLVDSNTELVVDFNGQLNINNLQITPPSNWNAGLSIGSASLTGNAYLQMEKDPLTGNGEFELNTTSGDVTGTISQFNAYILIGSNDLDVSLWEFQIEGAFSIDLDNGDDEAILSASGLLIVTNLQVEYGDLSISTNIDIQGDGDFSATYSDNNLDVSIDAAVTWDIWLNSALIGEWEAGGELNGNMDIEAVWSTGTGYVFVHIIEEGVFNLLDITHDDLNLNLVDILLPVGTVKFEWFRDSAEQEGYFLIDSELDGNVCTANLATITWGTKSVSVGWPCIKPGDFKFEWDIPDRFLRFRNGIENLAPTFTYKDTSTNFELFASSGSLPHDYSKPINFIWYLRNNQISGILIDTDGTYLTELIEIGFIKGSSGRKLAVYGIECDNFYIGTDSSGNLEWEGHIYIANHVIYSKLVSNDWKDFEVEWGLQGYEKWITFTKDPAFDFTLELDSITIGDFKFDAEVNLLSFDYFEVRWHIAEEGTIYLDTDWDPLASVTFTIEHMPSTDKIEIQVSSLRAEDWRVTWNAWPPSEWDLDFEGSLNIGSIDIWVTINDERIRLPI